MKIASINAVLLAVFANQVMASDDASLQQCSDGLLAFALCAQSNCASSCSDADFENNSAFDGVNDCASFTNAICQSPVSTCCPTCSDTFENALRCILAATPGAPSCDIDCSGGVGSPGSGALSRMTLAATAAGVVAGVSLLA